MMRNIDPTIVEAFGDEWSRLDQSHLSADHLKIFERYFRIFPWDSVPAGAIGFDLGCGSGRWARLVAPRIGTLHCIDPSEAALNVARRNLADQGNCEFHLASVDEIPLADGSMDFGYAVGVLQFVPDTAAGVQACVRKLKIGAPFLLYLYYAFDNRPRWFRVLWRTSDLLRVAICRLPYSARYVASQAVAAAIYYPLGRISRALERMGLNVDNIPLSYYKDKSFYTMRTNARDRFGTRVEKRFGAEEIRSMMELAGLQDIVFSQAPPYWTAVGWRSKAVLADEGGSDVAGKGAARPQPGRSA